MPVQEVCSSTHEILGNLAPINEVRPSVAPGSLVSVFDVVSAAADRGTSLPVLTAPPTRDANPHLSAPLVRCAAKREGNRWFASSKHRNATVVRSSTGDRGSVLKALARAENVKGLGPATRIPTIESELLALINDSIQDQKNKEVRLRL